MNSKILIFTFAWIVSLAAQKIAVAGPLHLTITTTKPIYNLGESITIQGDLTLNNATVSDGLVAIQADNPVNQTIMIRTRTTGTEPPKPWSIEIESFYMCDQLGNPRTSVQAGKSAGFKVTLRNNGQSSFWVVVPIYIQYSNNEPFTVFSIYNGTVDLDSAISIVTYPVPIPSTAPAGSTSAYASALTNLPINNGYAYCPEKKTTFTITSSLYSSMLFAEDANVASFANQPSYNVTFAVSSYGGYLGNYTTYATSKYSFYLTSNQSKFLVRLVTDITGRFNVSDGKVDIMDVALVSRCFGSYPGHPNWDPRADISGPTLMVPDGKVDVRDLALVSSDFGKYGVLP